MNTLDLHIKYAPIVHFSTGERFFPMSVADFLSYSALYAKGKEKPLLAAGEVTPRDLVHKRGGHETFVRSVSRGPLDGRAVARDWSTATLRLLYDWMQQPTVTWSEGIARAAYDWFSDKTKEATKRFWWSDLIMRRSAQEGAARAELPRFKLPADVRASALEQYEDNQGSRPNYTYYHRFTEQGDYFNLQYWFFYAYNDWANAYGGFNDHEGDWEGFHLFFRRDGRKPIEPPAYVTYLGHHSRITKPWDHPEVERVGTHPVLYVAAGSHASYPNARQYPLMAIYNLIDYATGNAFTLDHDDWRSRLSLDAVPWLLDYKGSWGTRYWLTLDVILQTLRLTSLNLRAIPREIPLPGVSAPRGPRFNDEGEERESWNHTAAFAGLVAK